MGNSNMSAEVQRGLHSWKQIAHYLGVTVRTAQRWEQERGLPVRRSQGVPGRITVYISELESWREGFPNSTGSAVFRWPLGTQITATVRFDGGPVDALHIEALREYLWLFRKGLQAMGPNEITEWRRNDEQSQLEQF
jgi:hypothetical protein